MKKVKDEKVNIKARQTVGKTENFFTRNVKLITFVVTISVFLALFLPIAMMEAHDYLTNKHDTRPQMTLNDLLELSDQDGYISAKQIEKYAGTENKNDRGETYYYINIEPYYTLLSISDEQTGMLIYCQLSNLETGNTVDVLTEDVRAFLQSN